MTASFKKLVIDAILGHEPAGRVFLSSDLPNYECELWDYKLTLEVDALALAELSRDVCAFHNSFGGVLLIGVDDDGVIQGFDTSIDCQVIRQKIRHYFGVTINLVLEELVADGKRLIALNIPRRDTGASVVVAERAGPQIPGKNKSLFEKGYVYFRDSDSSQLIQCSSDLRFLNSERVHSLLEAEQRSSQTLVQQNLPERNSICSVFVGRDEVKRDLWLWLGDRLTRYRVIAGPGGFGKTSAAYSFAEEVAKSASGFDQVLWLSAKKRQFAADKDLYVRLPYSGGGADSFANVAQLLDSLALALPIHQEWSDASDAERLDLLRDAFNAVPSLVILDDLDSLDTDEQRQIIELSMQLGSKTKFLLTTRNNFMAPAASTTKLPGLSGKDFRDYVTILEKRFGRQLPGHEVDRLERDTEGSPLFAESVFRLMKLGASSSEALNAWKGKEGEAARDAAFRRELEQLPSNARRTIFAMSRMDSASIVELCKNTELERTEIVDAIEQLDQLFLCTSEQIAGEPRFAVGENLRRVLDLLKQDFIPNFKEIERRVERARKEALGQGKSRGSRSQIAAAIRQAMAQLSSDDAQGAVHTLDEVLQANPNSADLWMVKARCLASCKSVDAELVRNSFARSHSLGKREARLFEKWLDFELESGTSNAAIDVIEKAGSANLQGNYEWSVKCAAAYFSRGGQRQARSELSDASSDYRHAIGLLRAALASAPSAARGSIRSAIQRATDALWDARPVSTSRPTIDALDICKEAFTAGDGRTIWEERVLVGLRSLYCEPSTAKPTQTRLSFYESFFRPRLSLASLNRLDDFVSKLPEKGEKG